MPRGEQTLSPTLWRTCRVLANRVRLRMLGVLLRHDEMAVSAVARAVGVSDVVASQELRALGARGLLAARRDGLWVFYRVSPDPSIRGTMELLSALRRAFSGRTQPAEAVFRLTTAFTHPRRIEIVRFLADGAMTSEALSRSSTIGRRALERHLAKLARRGFVRKVKGEWHLVCPRHPLAVALLQLACDTSPITASADTPIPRTGRQSRPPSPPPASARPPGRPSSI